MSGNEFKKIEIPRNILKATMDIKKYEPMEESLIIRQALNYGLKEMKKELAIKLFSERRITVSESARLANLSTIEMMDLFARRGIKSKISIEDFEQGLKNALKII